MSKNMQNLVVLMEPSEDACNISLMGGKMWLNRFSIDEDAAFELSGVHYLEKSLKNNLFDEKFEVVRKFKGKGTLGLLATISLGLISFIRVNHLNSHKKKNLIIRLLILHSKKLLKAKQNIWKYTLFMLVIIITIGTKIDLDH